MRRMVRVPEPARGGAAAAQGRQVEGMLPRPAQPIPVHEGAREAWRGPARQGGGAAMKRVAVLPMDDRQVNYDYPRYLSRAAGMEVLLAPREWLGNPWRASRHAELVEWLARNAPGGGAAGGAGGK